MCKRSWNHYSAASKFHLSVHKSRVESPHMQTYSMKLVYILSHIIGLSGLALSTLTMDGSTGLSLWSFHLRIFSWIRPGTYTDTQTHTDTRLNCLADKRREEQLWGMILTNGGEKHDEKSKKHGNMVSYPTRRGEGDCIHSQVRSLRTYQAFFCWRLHLLHPTCATFACTLTEQALEQQNYRQDYIASCSAFR